MDFGTLLHVAKKNSETSKNEGKYYSTKFAPPKKESKEKKLSENIQKFLQKREQEERERQRQEREKLALLNSKRDEKSKNKIKKMLKVTKSANKSVLDDAINTEHTAVTIQGPDQPDQDDYGYVSTEANAFYQKYIEKVKDVKEDKGFSPCRPQSLKDLSGTKERVKAAITKEIEEKKTHTRQRSTSGVAVTAITTKDTSSSIARTYTTSRVMYDPEAERREEERKKREEQKKSKQQRPAPPPMDFQALLKLAEKKQHEPIEIITEVKKKEPERLLTLKEKRELEERQREREAREHRKLERERNGELITDRSKEHERKERAKDSQITCNSRILKLSQTAKLAVSSVSSTSSKTASSLVSSGKSLSNSNKTNIQSGSNNFKKPNAPTTAVSLSSAQPSKTSVHSALNSKSAIPKPTSSISQKPSSLPSKPKSSTTALSSSNGRSIYNRSKNPHSGKNAHSGNTRKFNSEQDFRSLPPADVRKEPSQKAPDNRKSPVVQKRRILDDDEDEYDSELDDFIDDGDCDDDYSSHIKAIFGYDKAKYRDLADDDTAMESNFAQVQREEYLSKKFGIQEDLEDMKMEAIEKKRKKLMKKRKL